MLGQAELDELLSERDKLNAQLQEIIDAQTDPWGVKVSAVEVKHVDLLRDLKRINSHAVAIAYSVLDAPLISPRHAS